MMQSSCPDILPCIVLRRKMNTLCLHGDTCGISYAIENLPYSNWQSDLFRISAKPAIQACILRSGYASILCAALAGFYGRGAILFDANGTERDWRLLFHALLNSDSHLPDSRIIHK